MFYQIWTNFLVFFLAITLSPGITVRGFQGYIVAGAIYVIGLLILPKVIEFFKINVNIASFTIFNGLMSLAFFLIMKNIFFGFLDFANSVNTGGFLGMDFIGPSMLDSTGIVVYATLLITFLVSLNQWLMKH
jgi:hypothetical protein